MRGDITTRAVSGACKDIRQHGGRTALSVGTGDMDEPKLLLRISEKSQ